MSAAWKVVLEAFATAPEPISWALPGLNVKRVPKYEALLYLVEKGLVVQTGRERREWNDALYSVTPEGRFVYGAIKCSIDPRDGHVQHAELSAAARAVAEGPISVFDLGRVPWVWDKAAEESAACSEQETRRLKALAAEEAQDSAEWGEAP